MNLSAIDTKPKTADALWFDISASSFKIAHISSSEFQNGLSQHTVNGEIQTDRLCHLLASYILVDWAGVRDPSNNDLAYTQLLASYALFSNEQLRHFVLSTASDSLNFSRDLQ